MDCIDINLDYLFLDIKSHHFKQMLKLLSNIKHLEVTLVIWCYTLKIIRKTRQNSIHV